MSIFNFTICPNCKSSGCLVENEGNVVCVSCFYTLKQGDTLIENTKAKENAAKAAEAFRKKAGL